VALTQQSPGQSGPPPRVLQVIAPAPFGGAESVVVGLADGWRERGGGGIAALVAAHATRFVERVRVTGTPIWEVGAGRRGYVREVRDLRRLVRHERMSVVHTHVYRADAVGYLATRGSSVSLVATVHGYTKGDWKNRVYERFDRWLLRRFQAVACVSPALVEQMLAAGVDAARLRLIPNVPGAEAPMDRAAARAALGLSAADRVVGWIGRLSAEKAPDRFLAVLKRLQGPVVGLVIGDGPLRGELSSLVARLGDRARLAGAVDNADRLIPAFDVLVLSSRTEGTPIVLLEAMRSGVPVVSFAVGGIPDVLDGAGWLVAPGDLAALAGAIDEVLARPAEAGRRAALGRERITQRFGRAQWLDAYSELYEMGRKPVTQLAVVLLALGVAVPLYAYLGYPLLLTLLPPRRRSPEPPPAEWPAITIILPAHNEAAAIARTLDAILATNYPAARRRIVVISDASTDGTDEIVREFADRGVELVRLPARGGKTAAENAAAQRVRSEIVVNTDASVRLDPAALKPLIAAFADPTVGIASGRDVSVGSDENSANVGESDYVGYEMWVRDLETRAGGIVGASGCFFASRRELQGEIVPEALSRDFAAPLIAREHGFRAVSVRDAVCYVPRAGSLRREYRRKVRTMTRGLQTLYYKRHLLNPLRFGRFAWMLWSHKLLRWMLPLSVVTGGVGALLLTAELPALRPWLGGGVLVTAALGVAAWVWPGGGPPRLVAVPGYLVWGIVAALHAWINAMRGDLSPSWEPTRREPAAQPLGAAGSRRSASTDPAGS